MLILGESSDVLLIDNVVGKLDGLPVYEPFLLLSKCDICMSWKHLGRFEIWIPCKHGACIQCSLLIQKNKENKCQKCRETITNSIRLSVPVLSRDCVSFKICRTIENFTVRENTIQLSENQADTVYLTIRHVQ